MPHRKLTPPQLIALIHASKRLPGELWDAPREAAEECCDFGMLQPAHLEAFEPSDPRGLVYELTDAGRRVLAGWQES